MRRRTLLVLAAMVLGLAAPAAAQAPIEGELTLITPVSKFIHDAALKAFAEYAKETWNVTVRTNAIPAGTPVAYGRIVEWKGKPEADIFWGGESALFEKLVEQKLLQKVELSKEAWDSIPAAIGKPKPIPLKDKDGFWVGTARATIRRSVSSRPTRASSHASSSAPVITVPSERPASRPMVAAVRAWSPVTKTVWIPACAAVASASGTPGRS